MCCGLQKDDQEKKSRSCLAQSASGIGLREEVVISGDGRRHRQQNVRRHWHVHHHRLRRPLVHCNAVRAAHVERCSGEPRARCNEERHLKVRGSFRNSEPLVRCSEELPVGQNYASHFRRFHSIGS